MGWGKSISKGFKDAGKAIDKGAKDTGKAIEKTATDTGKAIEKTTTDAGNAIEKTAVDAGNAIVDTTNKVIDITKDTYNYAVDFANDTIKRTESIQATVLKSTEELAKAGLDTTSKEFNDLSRQVEKQVIAGVEVLKDVAEEAYQWLDENACRLALTSAISLGVVTYFTPKPAPGDPGTITSTSLSFMATPVLYTADMAAKMAVATAMAEVCVDAFLLIPGVKGSVNAKLLKNVISNCIYYSLDCAALWATPAGVGIAIGAAVAPVVATLICTSTCPNGFSKALSM
jgi:hypothetical protein